MRAVRKDYDKPNRCPGWSGSGIREYPWERGKPYCDSGSSGYYADDCNQRHFHQCGTCGLRTLPFAAAFVAGSLIMFMYNYITNKLFVFKKNKLI